MKTEKEAHDALATVVRRSMRRSGHSASACDDAALFAGLHGGLLLDAARTPQPSSVDIDDPDDRGWGWTVIIVLAIWTLLVLWVGLVTGMVIVSAYQKPAVESHR